MRARHLLGRLALYCLALGLAAGPAADSGLAQNGDEGLSLEPERTIAFDTSEGTYMNLDVSPDGTRIVFDLLGDLYTMPVEGGEATRITSGMAYDVQPVFSPDGSRIAFVSDRSGSDNIWAVAPDGTGLEAITEEREEPVSTPEFSPEGDYLVARRGGDVWLYHVDGGSGLQLTESELASGATGPSFGPEGRHVYFSSRGGGGFFSGGLAAINSWQTRRLDRLTGDVATITASPNGAFRPRISPDGKTMVFGARVDAVTGLRARHLPSGSERWLAWDIDRDNAERPGMLDLMPRYDFLPDGSAIVIATGGTFHRIDLETGADTPIAFSAHVEQELGPFVFFERPVEEGPVEVRNLRYANTAPDGSRIVFSALGRLWVSELPDGTPRELVEMEAGQFQPVWSPGGDEIVFVTWDDVEGGHVWRLPVDGPTAGDPVRLTEYPGFYLHPAWSPDGARIAFLQEDAAAFRNIWSRNTGRIVWVQAAGGPLHTVASAPSDNRLVFSPEGDRIAFIADVRPGSFFGDRPPESELISVRLDGTDRRTLATLKTESYEAVPSPDGKWVAWTTRENVYVAAVPLSPETPVIGETTGPGPVARVTDEGGIDVHWENGSGTLAWTYSDTFYRIGREEALTAPLEEEDEQGGMDDADGEPTTDDAPGEPATDEVQGQDEEAGPEPTAYTIDLTVPRHAPTGTLALVGARIIQMTGPDDVIEDGAVVIENNRITAVGPRSEVTIPEDADVRDVSGTTIMPGLIDMHAHLRPPREVYVETSWAYLANLAYGVTTTRDVSTSSDSFAYSELVESGAMIGPRIYSTGRAMTRGNAKIESLEDARNVVRRYKKLGTDVLKQYMQPHRRQRQWLIQAAREEGMNITNEGGGDFRLNMTQVLDGYTGVEHSLPIADVYGDVTELFARSRTWYTPTLVVSYGGPTAEWYFYQSTEVHDDDKLARFTPHDDLDRRTRRGRMYAIEEFHFDEVAAGAADILEAGGNVAMGAHGEQQGICAHWETWALQMGGLSNYDALRTATSLAAHGLGRLGDLGTVEAGKLADILVLEGNPLTNIRDTNTIRWVIKNGEVFAGDSLQMLWPEQRPAPPIGYRDIGDPPEDLDPIRDDGR